MMRHFLLGLGVTLILIFIILVTFNLELVNLADLDEEFIVEQVREKELESTFVEEAKEKFEAEITEEYIIDEAKKLGMNFDNQITDEFISKYYFTRGSFFSETDFLVSETIDAEIINDEINIEEIEKNNEKETITLFIRSGMNAREIAWLLKEEGLISDVTSFILLVNRFNMEDKIMAGTYHFSPDISTLRLLLEMTV